MRKSFALSHAVLVAGALLPSTFVAFQRQDALVTGPNYCFDWVAGAPALSSAGAALIGISMGSLILLIVNFARRK